MTTTENDNLEENSAGAVSVSLNPGQTIGGIGDPVLPSAETVGSGDMLSVADIDDDEEEAKKDKTQKNLEMESFHLTFASFVNESVVNEGKFDNIDVKDLHFETDEKRAEEMKIELGKRQGEVTKTKQIEGGEYSLRRFRKEIKFGDGTYLGVFLPGSYDAATSKLGDGPHKKAVKKIKWNQKKYDQWLEDVASNDGWKNAFDMAQNAKNEPGLIDWVKKNNRGEDAMQRIQWDIEAFAESVVTEAKVSLDDLMDFTSKHLKFVKTSKEFDGTDGGLWTSGEDGATFKGRRIYDYYSENHKSYTFGVLNVWEKELNKRGYYSEYYDAGTVMIWEE